MKSHFTKLAILCFTALLIINCSSDDDTTLEVGSTCNTPSGLLTYEIANQWEETYKENQYNYINTAVSNSTGADFLDNREFLFTLQELQCYLNYVEQQGAESGYSLDQMGIRVYLGAKADSINATPKTTVIFVPTVDEAMTGGKIASGQRPTFSGAQPKNYGTSGTPPIELE